MRTLEHSLLHLHICQLMIFAVHLSDLQKMRFQFQETIHYLEICVRYLVKMNVEMRDPLLSDQEQQETSYSVEDDFCYRNPVAKAPVHIRLAFLRKVYGILSVQILVTALLTAFSMFTPGVKFFIQENKWMMPLSFILSMATLMALFIKRRDTPINFVLLGIFTLIESYTISVIVSFYDQMAVLQAFLLTLAVTATLTAYTFQTKRDFSALPAVLTSLLLVLILGQLCNALFPSTPGELVVSMFGAGLFSLFIIVDTQMIMNVISPEEYILATIQLYLDIVNLFVQILQILGERR